MRVLSFPFVLIAIVGISVAIGCKKESYYFVHRYEIAPQGWYYDSTARFTFRIDDTARIFNLWLDVEHSPQYAWQNLYVQIRSYLPDGKIDTQVLSLELADESGHWQGHQRGKIIRAPILLQDSFYFPDTGQYRIEIDQYMRINPVRDVQALQLRLEEVHPPQKTTIYRSERTKR